MSPETDPYDPNDAEATRAFFAKADLIRKGKVVRRDKRGPQKVPTKKLVSLRLSAEVVEHFKATERGWQTWIDSTLRESIKRRAQSNESASCRLKKIQELLNGESCRLDKTS